MTVYITGDTHGRMDIDKLFSANFDENGLTKDDYVIIVGDFGLIWDAPGDTNPHAVLNEKTIDWLDSKPWTTLFVDGNHENHDALAAYPVSTWHGGQVHFIRGSVIHLMRGEMFDIDGDRYFAMGGAASIDKDCRVPGISWWSSELPDDAEMQHAIDTLDAYGWTCDYMLTHDCPSDVKFELGCRTGATYSMDSYSQWLQYLADNLSFSRWFFGHYHEDYASLGIGGRCTALYDYIYDVQADHWTDRMSFPTIMNIDQLPEPAHIHGYTVEEIASIANVPIEKVEKVVSWAMDGCTVAATEEGEMLIYRSDMFRILPWC